MQKIGIIANINKPQVKEVAVKLIAYLEQKKKKTVVLDSQLAKLVQRPKQGVPMRQVASRSDLIMVLGGDGTLIYAARMKALGDRPVLGINLGTFGFLASITVSELYQRLDQLWQRNFLIEPRMMLEATIKDKRLKSKIQNPNKLSNPQSAIRNPQSQSFLAFNDVVVAKEALARIIELTIYITDKTYSNSRILNRIEANQNQADVRDLHSAIRNLQVDGVIIATPTGSTAHSLSAGGPIVHPTLQALIITPICPHTLSNRPLIISDKEEVEIEVQSPEVRVSLPDATSDVGAIYLTVDGQQGIQISPHQRIIIRKAKQQVNLIVFPTRTYFEVLRTKLHWGTR
jgi:NAD+ kinase